MAYEICENGAIVRYGKYYLYNNLWGADTGSGTQCLWLTSKGDEPLGWTTQWQWSGPVNTIKSYAAVVLGWHEGWRIPDTGLPVQLSKIRRIDASWQFELAQHAADKVNVTFDMWFSDNAQHDTEKPTKEVMIWLTHTGNVQPIGFKQTEGDIAGTSWDLWEGPHPEQGWPVYSLVRAADTNAVALDLFVFFEFLYAYGLQPSDYLLSVEAGVEVFVGEGKLRTNFFEIKIDQASS